jgi:hypothetical protein
MEIGIQAWAPAYAGVTNRWKRTHDVVAAATDPDDMAAAATAPAGRHAQGGFRFASARRPLAGSEATNDMAASATAPAKGQAQGGFRFASARRPLARSEATTNFSMTLHAVFI